MAMSRRYSLTLAALSAVIVLLLTVDINAPADVGRWTPVALEGTALRSVIAFDDALIVAGPAGVWRVDGDRVEDLKVDVRVGHLLAHDGRVLAATETGVLVVDAAGAHRTIALDEVAVDALVEHGGRALAIADGGLIHVDDGSAVVEMGAGVRSATTFEGSLLLGLDQGVGQPDGDGGVEQLWDGRHVEELLAVSEEDGTRLLAAVRGPVPLLAATDPRGPWEPSSEGIRLATIARLVVDPVDSRQVLAGGTGLDDGESGERGGIADSTDAGRTWINERDRLSAVHVYDFATRREPLRIEVALAGRELGSVALPIPRVHTYASTNGAGLYRRQPDLPGASIAAALQPVGRLMAPAALGTLILWVGWGAFLRLSHRNGPPRRAVTFPMKEASHVRRTMSAVRRSRTSDQESKHVGSST